jgi:hypothetical protein
LAWIICGDSHSQRRRGQVAHRSVAGDVGEPVIGARRHDEVDRDAPARGHHQRRQQALVRHQVGGDRDDAVARAVEGRDQQRVHRVVRVVRAAGQQLRSGRRGRRRRPAISTGARGPHRGLARIEREAPVGIEDRCRLGGDVALQVEAEVDPGGPAGLAHEVLAGQVAPAAPEPAPVGNHQLAVVAQVGPPAQRPLQRRAERRHEADHPHPLRLRLGEVAPPAHQRPHPVDDQPHVYALPGALTQPIEQLGGEAVTTQDEGADVQAFARGPDHLEQRLRRLGAVPVHAKLAIAGRRRQPHRGGEVLRPARRDRVVRLRPARGMAHLGLGQLAGAEQQVERQPRLRDQQQRQHPAHGCGRVPALVQGVRAHRVDQQPDRRQQPVQREPLGEPGPGHRARVLRTALGPLGMATLPVLAARSDDICSWPHRSETERPPKWT